MDCNYCDGEKRMMPKKELMSKMSKKHGVDEGIFLGMHEGWLEVTGYINLYYVSEEVEILYCPMCGRKF